MEFLSSGFCMMIYTDSKFSAVPSLPQGHLKVIDLEWASVDFLLTFQSCHMPAMQLNITVNTLAIKL